MAKQFLMNGFYGQRFAVLAARQHFPAQLLRCVISRLLAPDEVPEFRTAERRKCTATVSSLRLDAVLAAMLHCSRG